MYPAPRVLPDRTTCVRCDAPTPTLAARMRHDELHAPSVEMEDSR